MNILLPLNSNYLSLQPSLLTSLPQKVQIKVAVDILCRAAISSVKLSSHSSVALNSSCRYLDDSLVYYAGNGELEMINLLLSLGASPYAKMGSALVAASENGHVETFIKLVSDKRVMQGENFWETINICLLAASYHKDEQMLKCLYKFIEKSQVSTDFRSIFSLSVLTMSSAIQWDILSFLNEHALIKESGLQSFYDHPYYESFLTKCHKVIELIKEKGWNFSSLNIYEHFNVMCNSETKRDTLHH